MGRGAIRRIKIKASKERQVMTAKVADTPTNPYNNPPMPKPVILATLQLLLFQEMAFGRISRSTNCGKKAKLVGLKKPRAIPVKKITV